MNSKPLRHPDFYMENIIFLVDDTLFKVPRSPFQRSGIFATIFTLPAGEGRLVEGGDDHHPFKLEGVSKIDFITFLRHLYPHCGLAEGPADTVDVWTSVLKLSTMWDFIEIRKSAISSLSDRITDAAKVVLGRQYKVPQWLFAGYEGLAKRKEPISMAEAEQLGFATAFRIGLARERVINRHSQSLGVERTLYDYSEEVTREFEVELKEVGHVGVPLKVWRRRQFM